MFEVLVFIHYCHKRIKTDTYLLNSEFVSNTKSERETFVVFGVSVFILLYSKESKLTPLCFNLYT